MLDGQVVAEPIDLSAKFEYVVGVWGRGRCGRGMKIWGGGIVLWYVLLIRKEEDG